jgi:hypothetical protein
MLSPLRSRFLKQTTINAQYLMFIQPYRPRILKTTDLKSYTYQLYTMYFGVALNFW